MKCHPSIQVLNSVIDVMWKLRDAQANHGKDRDSEHHDDEGKRIYHFSKGLIIRRVLNADGASPKIAWICIRQSIISLPLLKMDMISLRYLFVVFRNNKWQMYYSWTEHLNRFHSSSILLIVVKWIPFWPFWKATYFIVYNILSFGYSCRILCPF